jgi:hypothetical protein
VWNQEAGMATKEDFVRQLLKAANDAGKPMTDNDAHAESDKFFSEVFSDIAPAVLQAKVDEIIEAWIPN